MYFYDYFFNFYFLAFQQVTNLNNILDSNTYDVNSLDQYSQFLERCQNLDILDQVFQRKLKKNYDIPEYPVKNKQPEIQLKPKSNDIMGYLKLAGAKEKEKNAEEIPIFVKLL